MKEGGEVGTGGSSGDGGDLSSGSAVVSDLASGVVEVYSNRHAVAAVKTDGSVVTWGDAAHGGDSSSVVSDLTSGVETIAHVSENERIVIMFCAFEVPPKPCASTVAARSSCQPIQISPNSVSSFRPTLAPAPSFE